jgi:hypothetical protein
MKKLQTAALLVLFLSLSSLFPVPAHAQDAYDIEKATYDNVVLDVGEYTQDTRYLEFKPDGTRMYVVGRTTMNIAEFNLGTPWDISTAEFVREFDLSGELGTKVASPRPQGLFINKTNGQDMIVVNRLEIFQYRMSEPWNITTAEVTGHVDMRVPTSRIQGITVSPDGLNLYIDDRENGYVFQFEMNMIWNIETLTFRNIIDFKEEHRDTRGNDISSDGKRLFVIDRTRRQILYFDLQEPWNIRNAEYKGFFWVARQTPEPVSVRWNPEGNRFFVVCARNDRIFQYSIKQ